MNGIVNQIHWIRSDRRVTILRVCSTSSLEFFTRDVEKFEVVI